MITFVSHISNLCQKASNKLCELASVFVSVCQRKIKTLTMEIVTIQFQHNSSTCSTKALQSYLQHQHFEAKHILKPNSFRMFHKRQPNKNTNRLQERALKTTGVPNLRTVLLIFSYKELGTSKTRNDFNLPFMQ